MPVKLRAPVRVLFSATCVDIGLDVLTEQINAMKYHGEGAGIIAEISKMAATSEQVAAILEELTANAQQSAEASVHVAETVGEVSMNMEDQLHNIDQAKTNVDRVYEDVTSMAEKARTVTETFGRTAEAAQKGSSLMENAVKRMGNIEKSVLASADVVQKLGEKVGEQVQIVNVQKSNRRSPGRGAAVYCVPIAIWDCIRLSRVPDVR